MHMILNIKPTTLVTNGEGPVTPTDFGEYAAVITCKIIDIAPKTSAIKKTLPTKYAFIYYTRFSIIQHLFIVLYFFY